MSLYLCGSCLKPDDRRWLDGSTVTAGVCVRCEGQGHYIVRDSILEPRLAHRGISPVSTTDHSLARRVQVVWDVNGYYRDLGCRPGASRRELVEAYQALGPDPGARETYCLKQLLNEDVRERYDACQPGELFFDEVLRSVVVRRAAEEAAEALREGEADPEGDLGREDLSDALNRAVAVLDKADGRVHDSSTDWGYFLWNTLRPGGPALDRWRAMLADSLWGRGIARTIGVGYRGDPSLVTVQRVEGVDVVFLSHEAEPTHQAAECAADIIQQGL